jgi:DNA-binding winged helix-turn-helix (wHTH) protein
MTQAVPGTAQLFQIGDFQFCPRDGTIVGPSANVQLTPTESELLTVFCSHSDRVLSAKEAFDLAWHEPSAKGWRARVDTQLTNLRDKLDAHLPDLIQNVRGRGYRLGRKLGNLHSRPADPDDAKREISFAALRSRLWLRKDGGALLRNSTVLVVSRQPLELDEESQQQFVSNIQSGSISYIFLVPADALRVAVELVQLLVSSFRDEERQQFLFPAYSAQRLLGRLRLVVTPPPCPDSIYILNSDDQDHAEAFYCLHQDGRAVRIKNRLVAWHHARELFSIVPCGETVIQVVPGVDSRIPNQLQALLSDRLGSQYDAWADVLLAQSAAIVERRPPLTAHSPPAVGGGQEGVLL